MAPPEDRSEKQEVRGARFLRRTLAFCLLASVLTLLPSATHAACSGPDGDAGGMLYNQDHCAVQYCNGTNWKATSSSTCPIGFDDILDAAVSTVIESNIVQVSLGSTVDVTISGDGTPEFRICTDGTSEANCDGSVAHNWGSAEQSIDDGEYLQLRLTSSADAGALSRSRVKVGPRTESWDVTTESGPACTGGDCDGKIRVFITATGWRGDAMGGVTGADAKCQAIADGKSWAGTYRAWIADSNASSAPATRFEIAGTTLPMEQPGSNPGPSNWTDLTDGNNAGIHYDEDGNDVSSTLMWTNVQADGTRESSGNNCSNWTGTSGSGNAGVSNHPTGDDWTDRSTATTCWGSNHLYCFEMEVP